MTHLPKWIFERHRALGAVTEVRAIRTADKGERSIYAGIFGPDDLERLETSLIRRADKCRLRIPPGDHPHMGECNFYFTLNGINPKAATLTNKLERTRFVTRDIDIQVTTLFPIDVDPIRPANTSATDDEKRGALEVVERIDAWLLERGIGSVRADSGNGYHLLIPLKPITGTEVQRAGKLGKLLLYLLHTKFSTKEARVDCSVYNPGQILKLYGTLAAKGADTAERPHRMSWQMTEEIPPDVDLFGLLGSELISMTATPKEWSMRDGELMRLFRETQLQGLQPPIYNSVGANERQTTSDTQLAKNTEESGRRETALPMPPRAENIRESDWKQWRIAALRGLSLEAIYGEWLTGKTRHGWLECHDPFAVSGDQNPSAGVADGDGLAEKGAFHSFRTGDTLSVFDFMVRMGKVADLDSAFTRVAEQSGISLPERLAPSQEGHTIDLNRLERKIAALYQTTDLAIRMSLVRLLLAELRGVPQLELSLALSQIKRATGLSVTELKKELQAAWKLAPDTAPLKEEFEFVVDMVRGEMPVREVFKRLISKMKAAETFYCCHDGLLFLMPRGPIPVTEINLPGLLTSIMEIRMFQRTDGRLEVAGYEPLPPNMARAFVNSPLARTTLPPLNTYTNSPSFSKNWTFIGTRGYFPLDDGIYYDGPTIKPLRGRWPALDALLIGTPFHTEMDRANFIGALLTAATISQWANGHPIVVVNANEPNCDNFLVASLSWQWQLAW